MSCRCCSAVIFLPPFFFEDYYITFLLTTPSKDIAAASAEGEQLGLTVDELAFYDALTRPQAIKDFYEHEELIAITKELTDLLK